MGENFRNNELDYTTITSKQQKIFKITVVTKINYKSKTNYFLYWFWPFLTFLVKFEMLVFIILGFI